MLRHFVQGLCTRTSGRVLVASAIGVLAGVEHWMSTRPRLERTVPVRPKARPKRTDYVQIRRTVSELGYRYWVLQGVGTFSSFALFDTWDEARDEAVRRLEEQAAFETFSAAVLAR